VGHLAGRGTEGNIGMRQAGVLTAYVCVCVCAVGCSSLILRVCNSKVLIRMALGLLKYFKKHMKQLPNDELQEFLKKGIFEQPLEVNAFFKLAFSIKVSTKETDRYKQVYAKLKSDSVGPLVLY
jgi:hypothetical protein